MFPRIFVRTVRSVAGCNGEALAMYERMRMDGIKPGMDRVLGALKACSRARDLEAGRRIHKHSGCPSVAVANALVEMYGRCSSMSEARSVFDRISRPGAESWNLLIRGYADKGEWSTVLALYDRMRGERCEPRRATLLAGLQACSSLAGKGEAVKEKCLRRGRAMHSQVKSLKLESDAGVASALVEMYAKCDSMEEAHRVFGGMQEKTESSWNSILMGYVEKGEGQDALQIYSRMWDAGFAPSALTMAGALKACKVMALKEGKQAEWLEKARAIHSRARKYGLDADPKVESAVLDLYQMSGISLSSSEQQSNTVK